MTARKSKPHTMHAPQTRQARHTRRGQAPRRGAGTRAVVLGCGLLLAQLELGCSFAGVKPAPSVPNARAQRADELPPRLCTKSLWFPLLDMLGVAAGMTALGLGLGDDDAGFTAFGAGTTAIFTSSAVYGAVTVDTCEAPAKAQALAPHGAL